MLEIPDHGPIVSKLAEPIGVFSSAIEGIPAVTIYARMPEGLMDLSPEMAVALAHILIDHAARADREAASYDPRNDGGTTEVPLLTAI